MITFDIKTSPIWETLASGKYILQMTSIADNYIDSNKSESIEFAHIDLSPYNVLPYLVATDASKAWIDTGTPYQNGCKVEYKATLKGAANIFGVFYTTQRCRGYLNTAAAVFNVGVDATNNVYPTVSGLTTDTVYTVNITVNPNATITANGKTTTGNIGPQYLTWDSSPHSIYLFAVNRTNTDTAVQGKRVIHYFKYWDVNGNLLLDLIPVERKSDGVLGMVNKVNGQFLTNISTGTFYKEVPTN